MDRVTGQNGMSTSSWENIIAFLSYSPMAFGIFFLATAHETGDSYQDESSVSGIMAGLLCVAYGLCAGAASSNCPVDICKILILVRIGFGVVALLIGIFIAALGDETDKAIKFVLMYVFLGVMTLPEAGSFYMYARQVQLEKFMAEHAESFPATSQVQQWPPPSQPVPQFSGGVGYGAGVTGGDFGLGSPSPGPGPSMGSAAPHHAPTYT